MATVLRRRSARLWFAGLLCTGLLAGCAPLRYFSAAAHSTDDFQSLPEEPRILVEPGALAFAQAVAPHVTPAVMKVVAQQYRPFAQPVVIHVCVSQDSFSAYSGASKAVKGAVGHKLFLNPRLMATPERIPAILAHELSHLHLMQQLGGYRNYRNLPDWFKEGLAALVSDGGGAENVSAEEARQALRAGLRIEPVERDGLFLRKTADYWFGDKIADPAKRQHMFYRQSMLFVGYLRATDEVRFRQFLLHVQDGGDFTKSVHAAYARNLDELWRQFLSELPPV